MSPSLQLLESLTGIYKQQPYRATLYLLSVRAAAAVVVVAEVAAVDVVAVVVIVAVVVADNKKQL